MVRDNYLCPICNSIPRERALMVVLDSIFPNWSTLSIHESSPVFRGASQRIASEYKKYIPTFIIPAHLVAK